MERLTLCVQALWCLAFSLLPNLLISQALPAVLATTNAPICAGVHPLLLFEQGGDAVSWQWSGPNNFQSAAQHPQILNPGPVASGLYSVTITDAFGQTNSASVAVLVHTGLGIACNNLVQISLDDDGLVPLLPDMILEGGAQEDVFYTVHLENAVGQNVGSSVTCAMAGQTLTAVVTDTCTGISCWGQINVTDQLPPLIQCQNIQVPCAVQQYSPEYLKWNAGVGTAYPGVSDNCGPVSQSFTDIWHNGDCDDVLNGQSGLSAWVERRWTAMDASGNTSSCLQNIYIRRVGIPDLQLPPPRNLFCTEANLDPGTLGAPTVLFNGIPFKLYPDVQFCELSVTFTDEILPVCDGSKKILRKWLVLDWCQPISAQNPLNYVQVIAITDPTKPIINCPANLTVAADPFNCCANTNLPDAIVRDACSRINNGWVLVQQFDPVSGNPAGEFTLDADVSDFPNNNLWLPDTLLAFGMSGCIPIGVHTLTYYAEDDCGNAGSCSFRLTVADQTPPVAVCDEFTQVSLTSEGRAEVWAETFDDGSFDNCCLLRLDVRREDGFCTGDPLDYGPSVAFCCGDVGLPIPIILRAVDCHGNTNECTVIAYIDDKIKPVCKPPADFTVSCENFDPSLGVYGMAQGVDNCCVDTLTQSVNYNLFDTVCNIGTITRNFKVWDCAGNQSQCSQRIVVYYEQEYFIRMPNDAVVNRCDGTGLFGSPSFFGEDCELLGVSYEDAVFTIVPDACYRMERSWKFINWCTYNPAIPCVAIPNPEPSGNSSDPNNYRGPVISAPGTTGVWTPTTVSVVPSEAPTNFSQYYDTQANCYTYVQYIKVLDAQDPVINGPQGVDTICDYSANAADLWHADHWWDAQTSSHDLCEAPSDLSITAIDSCTGTNINVKYQLFLDLDGDGIMETVVNSVNLPPANTVNVGNAFNPNFNGGSPRAFDFRNVPPAQQYAFALQTQLDGGLVRASVRWNTPANPTQFVVPELPYGRHKIKWIVEDGCGNEKVREYDIVIRDCKKPTVVCYNGISANLMAGGMVPLFVHDFLQYGVDNCTPAPQLMYSLRKSGTGAGFPVDAAGLPIHAIVFDCSERGTRFVEVWARDHAGNEDFCETYALIQDNMGVCPDSSALVAGLLASELDNGLEQGIVGISGQSNAVPSFVFQTLSDQNGAYQFNAIPIGSNATVTPLKDDNPLNGVSTFDLVLISKHILGIQLLDSPYKMIAADANKNGSITATDIVEFRKLILGLYQKLPANTSWRFVDRDFDFPNTSNPFQSPFPEVKMYADLYGHRLDGDFTAIKVGDVNGSAIANSLTASDDRSADRFALRISDRWVEAGEYIDVLAGSEVAVSAYQFTLLGPGLHFESAEILEDTDPSFFAFFPEESAMTAAWTGTGSGDFRLRMKALRSGYLRDLLHLSNSITPCRAYREDGHVLEVELQFEAENQVLSRGVGVELYQNTPNPVQDKTNISFYLSEAGPAVLQVFDLQGREIWAHKGNFDRGYHTIPVNLKGVGAIGVLPYSLRVNGQLLTRKMTKME